ncbi:UNVERIFIED_CONTAM: hypothetical protein GTU68_002112, partial [Idotea baltica]|nr:hypothetical protein [Idotea baltica]
IAIVGGGLVGSLLSAYLGKAGLNVNVFEKRPDITIKEEEGGRSINLALSHRGWRALEEVGLADDIKPISIPMYGRMIHNLDGSLNFQAYGKENEAIYSVSRAALNRALDRFAHQFGNVNYQYDTSLTNYDRDNKKISIQHKDGKAETIEPDYIFACDGAFSRIRSTLQRSKRFNYSQHFLDHAYKELSIPPGSKGSWQIEKEALHIWPRESFMLIALPNLDGSFTCTLFLAFEGAISFEQLKTQEQVELFFNKYFPDALAMMPDLWETFNSNPTDSLVTIKCFPWSYGDHTLLLGDASHAIVPFYGQGMNAGFEDCRLLFKCIDPYLEANQAIDWSNIFKTFETHRKKDADAIADLALDHFIEMRDAVADPDFLMRKKLEKRMQELFPEVFLPAYSQVTFSHTPYSEALRNANLQNDFFNKILPECPQNEGDWDTYLENALPIWAALNK